MYFGSFPGSQIRCKIRSFPGPRQSHYQSVTSFCLFFFQNKLFWVSLSLKLNSDMKVQNFESAIKMKNVDEVAIFWDYGELKATSFISYNLFQKKTSENCPAPTNTSGYAIVNNIRSIAQNFGSVKLFKAYLEVTEHVPMSRAILLHSELQSSGVSLIHCPHNGRKDVTDKMILGMCFVST